MVVLAGMAYQASCSNAPPPEQEDIIDVAIADFAFDPRTVTIRQGQRVRWTNRETGFVVHTTTSGNPGDPDAGSLWDSGELSPGETFTRQFNDVGEFFYFCDVHESMTSMRGASIVVEALAEAP